MDTTPNQQPPDNQTPAAAPSEAPAAQPAPKTLQERMREKYPKTETKPCADCPDGRTAWGSTEPT